MSNKTDVVLEDGSNGAVSAIPSTTAHRNNANAKKISITKRKSSVNKGVGLNQSKHVEYNAEAVYETYQDLHTVSRKLSDSKYKPAYLITYFTFLSHIYKYLEAN